MIPKYLYSNILKILPYKAPNLPQELSTPLYLSLYQENSTKLGRQVHRLKVHKILKGGLVYVFSDEKVGLAAGLKDGETFITGADITRKAREYGFANIVLVGSELTDSQTAEVVSGIIQANYKYKILGTESKKKLLEEENHERYQQLSHLHLQEDFYEQPYLKQLVRLAEYKLYARDLANTRAEGTPQYFIKQAKALEGMQNVKVTVIEGQELEKHNLNLIYAVGKGSQHSPALINLVYKGNNDDDQYYGLVGKGITFDTGGLHLKPYGGMEKMYLDKSGASNVLATFKCIAEQGLKINVTATLCMAENAIGNASYKPGDILHSHRGLTVEINNTDAEGRLVLADGLSWTQSNFKLKSLIEMSTLTGACAAALGENTAGIMTNNDQLGQELLQIGESLSEPLWRLPVTKEHFNMMKSDHADLCNIGKSKVCGAQKAAAFLMSFVEKTTPYAHIDIAGPMESKTDKGLNPPGATGFGTQLLIKYLQSRQ